MRKISEVNPDIIELIQAVYNSPQWTMSAYIDNRPWRYPMQDIQEAAEILNIPIKVNPSRRRIKLGDRYIIVLSPNDIQRRLAGYALHYIGVHTFTRLSPGEACYAASQLRGEGKLTTSLSQYM